MKVELLHEKIKEALETRVFNEYDIENMSAEEVFNEFCLWEGFIGWGPALWNAMENIKEASGEFGWKGGVPGDKRGAFAVVFENGADSIIWDGEKPHAWQSVIAWHRIPDKPDLDYNPKAFREPDYGGWVGEYLFPTTPENRGL